MRDRDEERPSLLAGKTHRYWHFVFFMLVCALVFVVLRELGRVLTPVAAALILAYLLDPVVEFMRVSLRCPRWLGTAILFLLAIGVSALSLLLLVPLIIQEIQTFGDVIRDSLLPWVETVVIPWIEKTLSGTIPKQLRSLPHGAKADLQHLAQELVGPVGGVAGSVARSTAAFLSAAAMVALVPVFTFYFLPYFPNLVERAGTLIPPRFRQTVFSTAKEIDQVLAAWIRGQLVVMSLLSIAYAAGLTLVGLKLAVLVGLLTGALAFIPYVGFSIGATLALVLSLLEYRGPGQIIGIISVFAIVQSIEGLYLTPRLVGDRVGLGPVGVLIALMVGGQLFGFVGVLLAVPIAAVLAVIARRGISAYQASAMFLDDSGK